MPLHLYLLYKFYAYSFGYYSNGKVDLLAHKQKGKKTTLLSITFLYKVNNNTEINLRQEKKGWDFITL